MAEAGRSQGDDGTEVRKGDGHRCLGSHAQLAVCRKDGAARTVEERRWSAAGQLRGRLRRTTMS